MSEIRSNQFTTTINRGAGGGGAVTEQTPYNTQVIMYKGKQKLTPVSNTPSDGQYQVTIINTVNCEAQLESDYKTITVLSTTGNSGRIDISINVENIKTYTKSISVATVVSTGIVKKAYTQYKQLSDKFTWIVSGGDSQSTMTLSDKMFELISKDINLTANNINLEGYTTINGGFSVDTAGNMSCTNANVSGTVTGSIISGSEVTGDSFNVEGTLTAEKIECNEILSPKYPGVVTEDLKLYVSTSGDDDVDLKGGAIFASFKGLFEKLPKNLNGHKIRIVMNTDITENIEIVGYHGGNIYIYFNAHTLYGYVNSRMCSGRTNLYNGVIGDANSDSIGWGKIHPSQGYSIDGCTTTISIQDGGIIGIYNIDIYGADNRLTDSSDKVGVASSTFGNVYISETSFIGCDIGGRANAGGRIHDRQSWNVVTKYGMEATTGGYITLANHEHVGGQIENFHELYGGQIINGGGTFNGGTPQVPGSSAPVPPTTKTLTLKSISGDTYRSSVYNSWKKDNTVRQGEWSNYGDCNGCWFFGSDAFEDVLGKTITKVTIKITRQTGNGSSSAVGLVVRTHNHGTRPSGAPTLSSSSYGTLSLAWGESGTLTITNSTVLQGISKGTIKGFGIKTTYDSVHYAVCSGSCTVKITYKE